jgi:hypothetical protein
MLTPSSRRCFRRYILTLGCPRHALRGASYFLPVFKDKVMTLHLQVDAHLTRDNEVLTAANAIARHNFVLDGFGAGEHAVRVKPADKIEF